MPVRYSARNPKPRFETIGPLHPIATSGNKIELRYNWVLGAWIRAERYVVQVFRFVRFGPGVIGEWQVAELLKEQLP